jgi:outer membrane receptor protein involved in Fe transport
MDTTTIPELDPANPEFDANAQLCAGDRALCVVADQLQADTNNTSLAAYVQDSWQVLPNLTFNLGLRWEQQTGYVAKALQGTLTPEGETVPDAAYKLNNLLAPRLGFIYDPTKEGKAKVFGHWGRFYESVPMDLNVRAFGGEITNFSLLNPGRLAPGDTGYDPNCDVDYDNQSAGSDISKVIL